MRDRALGVGVLALATTLAAALALGTRPYAHPDEALHMDAFGWFEGRVWPPDLDSDEVRYDPYGTSKVYSLELAYPLLGNVGGALRALAPAAPRWRIQRWINLALLPLAFLPLLVARGGVLPLRSLGLALLCLPQVIYVFAYANSDAWAVAVSLWLLAWAARLASGSQPWPLRDALVLGLLLGLVLAAKRNFDFALVLPLALLAPRLRQSLSGRGLLGAVALAALVAAPLRVVYPLTQARHFDWAVFEMQQRRAAEGFARSRPTNPTVFLADRGLGWREVLVERGFALRTAQSFWGVYGYMTVFNPRPVYVAAGLLGLLSFGLTLASAARRRARLPAARRRLLLLSALVLAANFAVSLYMSYFYSFQPQGRYLFPSLGAVGVLLAGASDLEGAWARRLRGAVFSAAFALAGWSLLTVALPRLR